VVTWTVILSSKAAKDAEELNAAVLKPLAEELLRLLAHDPFTTPPRFEKLVGNLSGYYSRRVNIQHRLVFHVDAERKVVRVLRMWTHYV
jgi:Txe/YoeB family toxin of toxin-antitoxin system